jgi:hypothetical protein
MIKNKEEILRSRAQESSGAIERLYVTMRHLFNRGFYKPMGRSGETLREDLLLLRPEIYGSIAEDKLELKGLKYVIDRLPEGIEECRYINLTSDEGYSKSNFDVILPLKRRRNCYRIDSEQMNIEITRGRSEIYDILTHLTFLFLESHKIMKRVLVSETGVLKRDWIKLEAAVLASKKISIKTKETLLIHVASILGRTFIEVSNVYDDYATEKKPDRFLSIIYWLGKLAIEEEKGKEKREVAFSPILRERLGHHIHGEIWANNLKETLLKQNLFDRPIHVISANMHSVMNTLYAQSCLKSELNKKSLFQVYEDLSDDKNIALRARVFNKALKNGMIYLKDTSGANINVQIFDVSKIDKSKKDIIIVMDYAFGEQAYEIIDELLKPFEYDNQQTLLNLESISIMGKAGILSGKKGDIMIPSAHVFEGTSGNYPFCNELKVNDFENDDVNVVEGNMITVLGTSLQNKDILKFFNESTWNVIGLEMEGAHYQKAIQAATKIRHSIQKNLKIRYAYYASDNPLKTGGTLASGGLGTTGVKPTYIITKRIINQILKK